MTGGGRMPLFCRVWGLALLCSASLLWADVTQTGVLAGTVSDGDGVLLQGVEVQLSGTQGARRAVTDAAGRYRFPALAVGIYSLRAELLELTAERPAVAVYVGRSSDVWLVLRPPEASGDLPVEDFIQVVGEAPLVDRYDSRLGANLSFQFLDDLPVERFYQSFALLLPGVAGGADGNPNTSGALRSSNLFLVDGVDTTDPTTGLFGLNLSYETVQEVQVTTAASGVEVGRASGAVINVVTRSGGQRLQGLGRWTAGGDDFTGDYRQGDDRANLGLEIASANSGRSDLDSSLSLSLGGPLRADHLWFFASFQDAGSGFLRPTLLQEPWDSNSEIETTALKVTWQPSAQHTVVAQHNGDDSRFTSFQPFSRGPAELRLPDVAGSGMLENAFFQSLPGERFSLEDRRQEGSFTKLQWNAAWGQNLSMALTLADQQRRLSRAPLHRRGLTSDAPHVGAFLDPLAAGEQDLLLYVFNGITEEGSEERPRQQANLSLETFQRWRGIEHEVRFGVDYQDTESRVDIQVPGSDGLDPLTGRPIRGQLYIDFDQRLPCFAFDLCAPFDPENGTFQTVGLFNFYARPQRTSRETTSAVYVADTLVLDRWVIYVGLRWESIEGQDGAARDLVDDVDLAPRLALTYSFGKTQQKVLSASWGRFYEAFLHQYLDAFQRLEPLSGYTEYERLAGVDGLDCSTVEASDLGSPCWRASEVVAPLSLLPANPDRALERTSVSEWTLGYEHQLSRQSALQTHWVDRRWDDLWDGVATFIPQLDEVVVEVRNLVAAQRTYQALQMLYRRRLANHWQLLASYTWSEAEGNFFRQDGLGSLGDFAAFVDTNVSNRRGPAPYDRPHMAGLFATYDLPLGQAHLTLGSALQYRDGVPFHLSQLEPTGRRFVTPRGSQRLSGVWQWDLAASLDLDLGRGVALELRSEVFNLTDEQQQIGAETLLDSGLATLPSSLEDVQSPRAFRLTLGLSF